MDKTKIEWADATWNPVTGCLHGCEYCYARRIAERFGGASDYQTMPEYSQWETESTGENHVLDVQIYDRDRGHNAPYPFYFDPTMHRYRLDIPQRWTKPRTIFVCSMADLFGEWVPTRWIIDVLDACAASPQHRYLFLTKNPVRYLELDALALLPHGGGFWYGTTAEKGLAARNGQLAPARTFVSIEPIQGPVRIGRRTNRPDWVIVGAETGNRKGKVTPRREWIDSITEQCDALGVPVLMKDSLIPIVGAENMRREFPWE